MLLTCVTCYTADLAVLDMAFTLHQSTVRTKHLLAVIVSTVYCVEISTLLTFDNAVFTKIMQMQEQVLVWHLLETFVGTIYL